jgi:glycosyltransferase involved in cell wall biosynthesis
VSDVHLLVPEGYDDPRRVSGGNVYDQHLRTGLAELGWTVAVHEVSDAWPAPGPATARSVASELARIPDDDLVVVDGLLGTVAASAIVGRAARLRVVMLVHMPGSPGGPPSDVLRAARLVVATSRATARTLIDEHDLTPGSVLVAPPGVPRADLATGTASGGALLCVAAVCPSKGHDVLFAALADLAGRSWSCVCAGPLDRDPAFVDQQRQALAGSGLTDRVRLTGPLGGVELERAYAAADVLVLPSRHEGYGMVVTEALAWGLPVIATSVGGVAEALGIADGERLPGILVPPDDAPALGSAIADWLDDGDLRAALRSAAGRRRGRLAGWQPTVATISAAMADLAVA